MIGFFERAIQVIENSAQLRALRSPFKSEGDQHLSTAFLPPVTVIILEKTQLVTYKF